MTRTKFAVKIVCTWYTLESSVVKKTVVKIRFLVTQLLKIINKKLEKCDI